MPRTEPIRRDPWERWKGMVLAAKERLNMTDEDIAARLVYPATGGRQSAVPTKATGGQVARAAKGPTRQTVTKWRKDPDVMPLWAFARINRILEIEAQEAREAVVVVR